MKVVKPKKVPQRKCVGCETLKDKKALIRIVRSPEGEISLDKTGKKAGRGAYVCPDKECMTKAVKGKRLDKALDKTISQDVYEMLLKELEHEEG